MSGVKLVESTNCSTCTHFPCYYDFWEWY